MTKFDPKVFNICYPIVGLELHGNGTATVLRKSKLTGKPIAPEGRRDRKIMKFSQKSMSRLIATVNATDIQFRSMITLTYPAVWPKDGRIIKTAMNSFLTSLRDWKLGQYLWFLEFQTRGAPHFHVLVETGHITPHLRIAVTEKWVGKMSRANWFHMACGELALQTECCHWAVISKALKNSFWFTLRAETWQLLRDVDGAKKYCTKYAAKEYQKVVPATFEGVGRFWGASKGVSLKTLSTIKIDEVKLRELLVQTGHSTAQWDVIPKYLFALEEEKKEAHKNWVGVEGKKPKVSCPPMVFA